MCCFVFACMVTSLSVCRPLTKNQDKIRRWDTLCFVTSIHHYFQMEDRPNKTFQYCHTIIGVVCSIFPQTTTTIRKRWLLYLLSFSFLFVLQHFDSICPDKVSRNLFLPMINGVDNFFFVFFFAFLMHYGSEHYGLLYNKLGKEWVSKQRKERC